MAPIDLHIVMDPDDYLHGMRLYDSKEFMTGNMLVRSAIGAIVTGIAFGCSLGWPYVFLGLLTPVMIRIAAYAARKPQCREICASKIAEGPYDISFDDNGMISESKAGKVELAWSAFQKMIESPRVFLLVYARYGWVTVPKRAFADERQIDQFRELASSRIGVE